MVRRYYFSKFVGDGKTPASSFKAKVSSYGPRWGMLDLRPDTKQVEGWCFSFLDSDSDDCKCEQDPDLIPLGTDMQAELSDSLIGQISTSVGVNLIHTKLVDVITEVLFRQGRIRPAADGKYQIYLGSCIRELSAEEGVAFIGKILVAEQSKKTKTLQRDGTRKLSGLVKASLEAIRAVVNRGEPGWLEREVDLLGQQESLHPLIDNYKKASTALGGGEDALWNSHACNWVMMLANDMGIIADRGIDPGLFAPRLRTLHDCEPTMYELYVMAGYCEAGARVEKTDYGRAGEFRVTWNGTWVYVECKRKSPISVRDRQVEEIYRRGTEELHSLMKRHNSYIEVQISCRTDPNENDLATVIGAVEDALTNGVSCGKACKIGKLEITVGPIQMDAAGPSSGFSGLRVPAGFEHAACQGEVASVENGIPVLKNVWSIAWRSQLGSGWVKSALESFRLAASQLPKEGPGLVYLEVPGGTEETVFGRLAILEPAVEKQIGSEKRVNAAILTATCLVTDKLDQSVAVTRVIYKTISSKDARTPLPEGFKVLGRHVTRGSG